MTLHHVLKLHTLYKKNGMVAKADNIPKIESTMSVNDDCDGNESSTSNNIVIKISLLNLMKSLYIINEMSILL